MKRPAMVIVAAVLAVSIAGAAAAQTCPRYPERRVLRQELRIRQGVRAGQLTPREVRRLHRGARHLRRMELRARADGSLTPRECIRLERARERQHARIWRLRHNGRAI